jgi:hypothetical protein
LGGYKTQPTAGDRTKPKKVRKQMTFKQIQRKKCPEPIQKARHQLSNK